MQQKTSFIYKTVGTLDIALDVYRGTGEGKQPAILWLHGGALIMGSRAQLPPAGLFERLMAAGYTVVSVDYRLAPETQLAGIMEDVEDAYAWVLERGLELSAIDATRIAIAGMSAGAYLTLTAGFRVRPGPKALVSFYGYGDITGPWYTEPSAFYRERYPAVDREQGYRQVQGPPVSGASSDVTMKGRPDFYLYCRQNGLWPQAVGGHDPVDEAAWFAGYEPLRNVSSAYPPTLLLHGEKDTDVPYEQSVIMAEALRRSGVIHDVVSNPEWGHAFDYAEDDPAIAAAFDRVMSFLAERLG